MTEPSELSSRRWKIGVTLIGANFPVALGGGALAAVLAAALHSPHWLLLGAVIYAISWVMLGIGVWLAGWEGMRYAQGLWKRWMRRR